MKIKHPSIRLDGFQYQDIANLIYEYPVKSQYGFNKNEIKSLLQKYPNLNIDAFNNALMGVTGMVEDNEFIYYKHDILKAFQCGLENRGLTLEEWD